VGAAFALALARAGARVEVASRTPRRARALVEKLAAAGPKPAARRLEVAADGGDAPDLLLLAVPEHALGSVDEDQAGQLAEPPRGAAALTASGYEGGGALGALEDAGWAVGSLHPLLALPAPGRGADPGEAADRLRGASFAVEGEPAAVRAARRVVRALDGRPLVLDGEPGDKALYHAACALASNGLVALFDLAAGELERVAPARAGREALIGLLEATLENLRERGARRALTGPVVRGDAEVVLGHLAALGDGEAGDAYRALSRALVELAAERGTDPAALDEIRALLGGSRQ
jgi:predicted short-subunit dehydrogenase-like oxidoreductase (DUF2520 family)